MIARGAMFGLWIMLDFTLIDDENILRYHLHIWHGSGWRRWPPRGAVSPGKEVSCAAPSPWPLSPATQPWWWWQPHWDPWACLLPAWRAALLAARPPSPHQKPWESEDSSFSLHKQDINSKGSAEYLLRCIFMCKTLPTPQKPFS